MENYLMLNGKKVELTEEQIKVLGLEVKPKYEDFLKIDIEKDTYYATTSTGEAFCAYDDLSRTDGLRYDRAIYYKTKEQAEMASQMDEMDRIFAWIKNYVIRNDDGWRADWEDFRQNKHYIYYSLQKNCWDFGRINCTMSNDILMSNEMAEKLVEILNRDYKI